MSSRQSVDKSNKAAYKSFQDDTNAQGKMDLFNSMDSKREESVKLEQVLKAKEEPSTAESFRSSINESIRSFSMWNSCNKSGPSSTGCTLISEFLKPTDSGLFCYKLSSGNYGILFKNSAKIVVSQDLFQFYYLRRSQSNGKSQFKASLHNFDKVPVCLKPHLREIYSSLQSLCGKKMLHDPGDSESVDESFYLSQNIVY
mmetsp:Transcript_27768/g.27647  ORF Transcript_27768/g.27647 Transcript_27768/m.27647 type:complete len:200 (+) Transcript_27768:918-1517(+)